MPGVRKSSVLPHAALVEQTLVQHVQQLLAGEITAEVLAEQVGLCGVDQARHNVRSVGADDDVIELPQRALFGQRFDLEHVERRPGEMAALKRLDERRLIDHGTPSYVDEVGTPFDSGYRLRVEQPLRLGRAWQCHSNVVRLAEGAAQLRRRVQLIGVVPGFVFLAHRALDPDNAHTKRSRPLRYGATDTPHPDDAERLALEGPHRPLTPDLPGLGAAEVVELLGVLEHRHEHELGERPRVDPAGRGHRDLRVAETGLLCHLSGAGHASLHPPELGRDPYEIPDVTTGEVVEDLGLTQHPQKLLLLFRRSFPFFRSRVVPRPPRRRDQILPVEHPQPFVPFPYATYVLFLEVARYDDRGHGISPLSIVILALSEDQRLEVEPSGPLGGDRHQPEGTDVEQSGYHLPESLVSVEGEEPLRLIRVVRPHALVVLSPIDSEVEEAAWLEDGPDPAQCGGKLAPGQVKQAVEGVDCVESLGWEVQFREVHHACREALVLAELDHLGR